MEGLKSSFTAKSKEQEKILSKKKITNSEKRVKEEE